MVVMVAEHILIIDDDLELAAMLRDYLDADGWQVSSASNGNDGLRQALSGRV